MLADFFTKPLQGNLFLKFRSVILGHAHIRTIARRPLTGTEERVEREVVNDGSSGHSQCDLEESTYVAGMKATLPSTNRWLDCSESAFAQWAQGSFFWFNPIVLIQYELLFLMRIIAWIRLVN
jgi:hypothetical protein